MARQKRRKKQSLAQQLHHVFLPHEHNGRHPHLFRTNIVLAVIATVIVVELAFLAQLMLFSRTLTMTAAVLPAAITDLTNAQRAQDGESALSVSALLSEAAQEKADDMAAKGYFAHQAPDGTLPWHWFDQVGYDYQFAGENLAINFSDSSDVVNAWMQSPAHRANILKQDYTQIGIGIADGMYQGRETTFVVQFFGSPAASAPAAASARPAHVAQPIAHVAPTTPVETAAPAQVLGSQTAIKTQSSPWWMQIAASPHTWMTYALIAVGAFFALFLLLGLVPRGGRRLHGSALVNGSGLVAVMLALMVFNGSVTGSAIVSPPDSQHASAALALPR